MAAAGVVLVFKTKLRQCKVSWKDARFESPATPQPGTDVHQGPSDDVLAMMLITSVGQVKAVLCQGRWLVVILVTNVEPNSGAGG